MCRIDMICQQVLSVISIWTQVTLYPFFLSWTWRWWTFTKYVLENGLSHTSQLTILSWWMYMWTFRDRGFDKVLQHILHCTVLSLCIFLIWFLKWALCPKSFPQFSHLNNFNFSWTTVMWDLRYWVDTKDWLHTWHWNVFAVFSLWL